MNTPHAKHQPSPLPVPPAAAVVQLNVLLVDDDTSVLRSLARVLNLEGYCVTAAANAAAAEAAFRSQIIHLAILDIHMPGRNGWELLDHLQSIDARVPVILITALPDQYRQAAESRAVALIEKPLQINALLQLCHRLCWGNFSDRLAMARTGSPFQHYVQGAAKPVINPPP